MADQQSEGSLRPLWALLAAFAALWIGWAALLALNPATLGADTAGAILLRNAVRLAVWGGAATWFVRRHPEGPRRRPLLEYLRLRGNWRGAALGALVALAWAGGALLLKGGAGGPSLNGWVTAVICAPLAEELLFRGVVFQRLAAHWPVWQATLVSSLLFAAIHAPYWLMSGSKQGAALLIDLAAVAALGALFALALRRTGSLWSAIALHMANNFAASL